MYDGFEHTLFNTDGVGEAAEVCMATLSTQGYVK